MNDNDKKVLDYLDRANTVYHTYFHTDRMAQTINGDIIKISQMIQIEELKEKTKEV